MASQQETEEMLHAMVEHKLHLENNIFHGIKGIPKVVEKAENMEYRGKAVIVIDEQAVGVVAGEGRV